MRSLLKRMTPALAAIVLGCMTAACDDASSIATGATDDVAAASGAAYPQHPVHTIVPFGAGGLADVSTRIVGEQLSLALGQRFIIDNRPGAGAPAKAVLLAGEADGYTLVVVTNGNAVAESRYPDLDYDIQHDLKPVSALAWFDLVLLVRADSALDSVQALLERAKQQPAGLRIATVSAVGTPYLGALLFRTRSGINATVTTYRTSADVLGALQRQEADVAFDTYTVMKGPIDNGEVAVVAVSGDRRNAALPAVPTVLESGLLDYVVTGWNALYVKAATPDSIVQQLHAAVVAITADPSVQSRFTELGVVARASTPDEMRQRMAEDIARWRPVVVAANLVKGTDAGPAVRQ